MRYLENANQRPIVKPKIGKPYRVLIFNGNPLVQASSDEVVLVTSANETSKPQFLFHRLDGGPDVLLSMDEVEPVHD